MSTRMLPEETIDKDKEDRVDKGFLDVAAYAEHRELRVGRANIIVNLLISFFDFKSKIDRVY